MKEDFEPKLTMSSVELAASNSAQRQYAFLIYADDDLVAVLTQSQQLAATARRRSWILEAGFGPCKGPERTVWHDLGEFHQWVLERCRAADTGSELYLGRRTAGRSPSGTRARDVDEGYAGWEVRPARKVRPAVH